MRIKSFTVPALADPDTIINDWVIEHQAILLGITASGPISTIPPPSQRFNQMHRTHDTPETYIRYTILFKGYTED